MTYIGWIYWGGGSVFDGLTCRIGVVEPIFSQDHSRGASQEQSEFTLVYVWSAMRQLALR